MQRCSGGEYSGPGGQDESLGQLDLLLTAVAETTGHPFLVLTADLRVESAIRAFCETFKVTAQETLNCSLLELGNRQWDIPELHAVLGSGPTNWIPKGAEF